MQCVKQQVARSPETTYKSTGQPKDLSKWSVKRPKIFAIKENIISTKANIVKCTQHITSNHSILTGQPNFPPLVVRWATNDLNLFHILFMMWAISLLHFNLMLFKSPANGPFIQQVVHTYNKRNITAPHNWPFVKGIHRWLLDSPHKEPLIEKAFPCHDVIMLNSPST